MIKRKFNTVITRNSKINELPSYIQIGADSEEKSYQVFLEKSILLKFHFLSKVADGSDESNLYQDPYARAIDYIHTAILAVDCMAFEDDTESAKNIERIFIKKLYQVGAILGEYSQNHLDQNFIIAVVLPIKKNRIGELHELLENS
jgi:hypothetical protein